MAARTRSPTRVSGGDVTTGEAVDEQMTDVHDVTGRGGAHLVQAGFGQHCSRPAAVTRNLVTADQSLLLQPGGGVREPRERGRRERREAAHLHAQVRLLGEPGEHHVLEEAHTGLRLELYVQRPWQLDDESRHRQPRPALVLGEPPDVLAPVLRAADRVSLLRCVER